MKKAYVVLGFLCLAWAAWSLVRWLLYAPSDAGGQPGWRWLVSIVLELVLAGAFFAMASQKRS